MKPPPRPFKRMHPPPPRPGTRPPAPPHADAGPVSLLRMKTQRRLALQNRMGLLRHKSSSEELNEVERKMLDHELAIAEELQSNLLPKRVPRRPGFDISAYYRPSHEVGGDYYDFIEIDEEHLGIVVADVSGKGIPGSIIMTETRALMKSEATRTLSPSATLTRVNKVLYEDIKRGMFVTMFYMVLDAGRRQMVCASAGHNPLVLWRAATKTFELVNPNGLALGIDKGPLFEKTIKEQKLQLNPGDRFVLYTDGVVETMNATHSAYSPAKLHKRTAELAHRTSSEFLSLVVRDLELHQAGAPQHDDITIVTGRVMDSPPPASP